MIDIQSETVIPLTKAAKRVPSRNGRTVHVSTIWRWTMRGVHGIKLESLLVGGTRCTSVEAIGRFIQRLNCTGDECDDCMGHPDRAHEAAEAELDRLGV